MHIFKVKKVIQKYSKKDLYILNYVYVYLRKRKSLHLRILIYIFRLFTRITDYELM